MNKTQLQIAGLVLAISATVGLTLHSTDAFAGNSQSTSEPTPTRVSLESIPFGADRSGIQVEVTMAKGRFRWVAPAETNSHVAGEGYAVLLLDGHESGRLSSPAFAITDMQGKAAVEARVRLMRNDHEPYRAATGELLEATLTIRN